MKTVICLLFSTFALINGALVDVLGTCKLGENPCELNQYQRALNELAQNGDSSLNVPVLDPLAISNIHVVTRDKFIDFTVLTGTVKGIKSCVITRTDVDKNNLFATITVKCNVDVECKYKAKLSGALGLLLNQQVVHGDGDAKISLDGLVLTMYKPFYVDEQDNDYYVVCENTNNTYGYDYEVKNKAVFDINNIYAGTQDISALVKLTLNTNWRFYLQKYGRDFLDEVMKIIYSIAHRVFDNIPAQTYISDIADYYDGN